MLAEKPFCLTAIDDNLKKIVTGRQPVYCSLLSLSPYGSQVILLIPGNPWLPRDERGKSPLGWFYGAFTGFLVSKDFPLLFLGIQIFLAMKGIAQDLLGLRKRLSVYPCPCWVHCQTYTMELAQTEFQLISLFTNFISELEQCMVLVEMGTYHGSALFTDRTYRYYTGAKDSTPCILL